ALALPAFTRTAWSRPRDTRSSATSTGAARTRLRVNTPAAATGSSATTRATSRPPFFLMPAAAAEKRNPAIEVMAAWVRDGTKRGREQRRRGLERCGADRRRERRPYQVPPAQGRWARAAERGAAGGAAGGEGRRRRSAA